MDLSRYVGKNVILKERIPADKRGYWIEKGVTLIVTKIYGQFMNLKYQDGKLAANQVHYTKVMTG